MRYSEYMLYILIFINGFFTAGRCVTGYTYFTEFWPSENRTNIGTIWQMLEGSVTILMSLYFVFVSKNWFWLIFMAVIVTTPTMIYAYKTIPESPQWLYDQKRYLECYEVLSEMARYNGV